MSSETQTEHAVQTGVVLIPLNKLKKSPKNARKTPHAKAEIEALAASIHAKGMLQNLVVEPEHDSDGAQTGAYLVTAGEGRRLAQMLRVKRKQISLTEPICCVIDTTNDALEISLDENVTRTPMSVMDEVEAFANLVDSGMTTRAHRDVAGDITATILAELEQGVLPWRKPWDGARTGLALPRRATGETYRGVNVLILWSAALERSYASPYWLTFNQAVKLGAHVRKGERGEIVVYYGQGVRKRLDDGGAEVEDGFRFLKWYVVFSADQIDNLPARFHPAPADPAIMPVAAHEAWFAGLDIKRVRTQDIACYIPSKDVIGMPAIQAFDTPEDYAATLDHESVHATMAPHRVGRDMGWRFNAHALASEELVAEIGASLLGAHLHLPPHHIHDHASYIGHWMKLLADDKRAFLTAAAQAQRAVDWLLAKSPAPGDDAEALHVAA